MNIMNGTKPLFNKVFKFDVNINIIFYNNLFFNIL